LPKSARIFDNPLDYLLPAAIRIIIRRRSFSNQPIVFSRKIVHSSLQRRTNVLKLNLFLMACSTGLALGLSAMAAAQQVGGASDHTKKIQARVLEQLPFADQQDFADAQRGFIAPLPDGGVIRAQDGRPVCRAWG